MEWWQTLLVAVAPLLVSSVAMVIQASLQAESQRQLITSNEAGAAAQRDHEARAAENARMAQVASRRREQELDSHESALAALRLAGGMLHRIAIGEVSPGRASAQYREYMTDARLKLIRVSLLAPPEVAKAGADAVAWMGEVRLTEDSPRHPQMFGIVSAQSVADHALALIAHYENSAAGSLAAEGVQA